MKEALLIFRQMKKEGLQLDLLPTDIAEIYEEVEDMSEGFSKQDEELEQTASSLLHNNTAEFYTALPDTSLLKKNYNNEQQQPLVRKLARIEQKQELRIEKANFPDEVDKILLDLAEGVNWREYKEVGGEKVLEQLQEKAKERRQELEQKKETPAAQNSVSENKSKSEAKTTQTPEVLTCKDLAQTSVEKVKGKYPRQFELNGSKYRQPSFLGVTMLRVWRKVS